MKKIAVRASRPSRARGLKLPPRHRTRPVREVAPFAGAWIETVHGGPDERLEAVAPFAGAWIETAIRRYRNISYGRRALRGRVD